MTVAPSADVIIVLGHRVMSDGRLGGELSRRLERGLELLRAGRAPILLCSGGRDPDEPVSAAEAMLRVAVEAGVEARCLLASPRPRTTLEEAVVCRLDFAEPCGWRRLLLVTSDYHAPRAVAAFTLAHGPEVEIAAEPVIGSFGDSKQLERHESEGIVRLRAIAEGLSPGDVAGLVERMPGYRSQPADDGPHGARDFPEV